MRPEIKGERCRERTMEGKINQSINQPIISIIQWTNKSVVISDRWIHLCKIMYLKQMSFSFWTSCHVDSKCCSTNEPYLTRIFIMCSFIHHFCFDVWWVRLLTLIQRLDLNQDSSSCLCFRSALHFFSIVYAHCTLYKHCRAKIGNKLSPGDWHCTMLGVLVLCGWGGGCQWVSVGAGGQRYKKRRERREGKSQEDA